MIKQFQVNAVSIADAWFQLIYNLADYGYKQTIQTGSFEGEYRMQYPGVAFFISNPDTDMIPYIPTELNIPSPTTQEYVEDYFVDYIMNPELSENETYRYSSRINKLMPNGKTQLQDIIDEMAINPLGNQYTCEIGSPDDRAVCFGKDGKLDPPCLRLIDFKVVPDHIYTKGKYTSNVVNKGSVPGTSGYYDYKCNVCGHAWICGTKLPCTKCHPEITDDNINDTELLLTVSVFFRSWDLWAALPTNLGGIELLKQYVISEVNHRAGKELLKNGPMFAYSSGLHTYGYQEELVKIRTRRRDMSCL